jgi:putative transcriptional regulator
VLKAMAFQGQPSNALFALGYCGWSPGQLEDEIKANGWLTVPYSRYLLFDAPIETRYEAALGQLGITRASLSSVAGNA